MFNLFKKISILFLCTINIFIVNLNNKRIKDPSYEKSWHGIASWYGPGFHGRTTANGEIYNKNKLTAAHKTLPFNTKVLVTNLKNNKSVLVRINDRGPFIEDRIIDLSEEAAKKIDSKIQGIAHVKVQVLASTTTSLH